MQPVGYLTLIRNNREYDKLWLGQIVSLFGDWLNYIAVLALVYELTQSGLATGVLLVATSLPAFFLAPIAGVIVDRLDRKRVMIAADLARAILALGMLVVRAPDQIWVLYVLTAILVSFGAFFNPAQSAAIPNLVAENELIAANALSGATWGMMLALGSAIGGAMIATIGRDMAFVINSLSFVFSAAMIVWIRKSFAEKRAARASAAASTYRDLMGGFNFVRASPPVFAALLVKAGWGLGTGLFLLLTIFAQSIFRAGAAGIGWLYAARGIGVLIGPNLSRGFVGNNLARMRGMIVIGMLVAGAGYLAFSYAPLLWLGALAVMVAHFGGGTIWVMSSTIMQILVPDKLRGRVFAMDSGLYTVGNSISTFLVGAALDKIDARAVGTALSVVILTFGLVWGAGVWWSSRANPRVWSAEKL